MIKSEMQDEQSQIDFEEWLNHPITQARIQMIKKEIVARKELINTGTLVQDATSFEAVGERYTIMVHAIAAFDLALWYLTQFEAFDPEEDINEDTATGA